MTSQLQFLTMIAEAIRKLGYSAKYLKLVACENKLAYLGNY